MLLQRVILFRGKRTDNGEWVYGIPASFRKIDNVVRATMIPEIDGEHCMSECVCVDPDTVGQYIGQTDKNGVRIFEGDIVRVDPTPINGREFDGYSAVVGFTGGAFGLERVDVYCNRNAHYLEHGFCEVFWPFGHCEYLVIGNIHDNPEMLSA